jgi:hypothetical protein
VRLVSLCCTLSPSRNLGYGRESLFIDDGSVKNNRDDMGFNILVKKVYLRIVLVIHPFLCLDTE